MTDRVVLVTGGSGALGSVVIDEFLEAGAIVAGVARSWKPDVFAKRSDLFLGVAADLTTTEGARTAIAKTLERTQRIDAVVHAMGAFEGGTPVHETDDGVWERMINLNLRSAFAIFREALPHMLAQKRGRLVAVGSRASLEPAATLSAYGVSKAGLAALVRTVALEVAGTGVTANAVLPSIIDTPANRASDPSGDYSQWVKPESIADLILWLTSDAAADVNGALIPIYGGS